MKPEPGEIRTRWLPMYSAPAVGRDFKKTDEVVVRDLRRSTTELQRDTLGLRWRESNPRPPAYKACTPSRQSVLYHWPGDEGVVRLIALPLSYTRQEAKASDRIRTDNRCTRTGSRRGQSHFSKETANEENGSDATLNRCSPNRQLAVRDAGGNRTHLKPGCSRSPGRLAPASSILVRSRT